MSHLFSSTTATNQLTLAYQRFAETPTQVTTQYTQLSLGSQPFVLVGDHETIATSNIKTTSKIQLVTLPRGIFGGAQRLKLGGSSPSSFPFAATYVISKYIIAMRMYMLSITGVYFYILYCDM